MPNLDGLFTVLVVDGDVVDYADVGTQALRYDGLSWTDSIELVRLSFMQGYTVCIWRQEGGDDEQKGAGGAA